MVIKKKYPKKKYPKFIQKLLVLTSDNDMVPTDKELDRHIQTLTWYMHYVWPLFRTIVKRKIFLFFRYRWKYILRKLILTAVILYCIYFVYNVLMRSTVQQFVIENKVTEIEKEILTNPIPRENIEFMIALSLLESNHNYKASEKTNSQYWGVYQMGNAARMEVGLGSMPKKVFLNNPSIQNWAMNEYMKKNHEYLKTLIIEYNIPEKGGVRIGMHLVTVSGLIAAAHLVGAGAVKTFFKSNGSIVPRDGNNKPLTDYLQLNNFHLEFED